MDCVIKIVRGVVDGDNHSERIRIIKLTILEIGRVAESVVEDNRSATITSYQFNINKLKCDQIESFQSSTNFNHHNKYPNHLSFRAKLIKSP